MELGIDLAPNNPRHLKLKNPVMIASGTFGFDGYGSGIPPEMPLDQLGAVVPKTVTRYPRQGNPEPRGTLGPIAAPLTMERYLS